MIQLASVFWLGILCFGIIGYLRGFDKELIALAGIILALFTLVQFDDFFVSLAESSGSPARTQFYLQMLIVLAVTFFAYQTPPGKFTSGGRSRDRFQVRLLGTVTGAFNGYLVVGSLWYFMHIQNYPLDSVLPPAPNSPSAGLVDSLPLFWLLQGNLLTLLVIGLFLFILITLI